tara:strand:- start:250 stop:624 length:375 start_codon:yes stop_codon:yes gene_type:complete
MGSIVSRTVTTHYSMVRRAAKGKDRYGKGEDKISVQFVMLHKGKKIRLGTFPLEAMAALLGTGDADYIKMVDFASNAKKGVDGDRSSSVANSAWSSTILNTKLIPWSKTYKSASPYMMYYSNLT